MISNKDRFQKFIIGSILGHLLILLLFKFNLGFLKKENIEIKNAIRVNIVALPDKILTKKKYVKSIKSPRKKISLKKLKNKQLNAFQKLKQTQAIKALKSKISKSKVEKKSQKIDKKITYKGRIINDGTSLKGLNKIEMSRYYQSVKEQIHKHWSLPQWLLDLNLKAQVLVLVDEHGYVIQKEIYSTSHNQSFDEFVISTIEKASPLPKPPPRLSGSLKSNGFVLKFPN